MNNQDNQRQAVLYAYMAGLLDGEGTIRICKWIPKGKKSNWHPVYNVSIGIVNVNQQVIKLFRDTFFGNSGIDHKERTERVHNRQVIYRWGTCGNQSVLYPIKTLLPYLIIKKPQAELAIRFLEEKNTDGFKRGKKKTDKKLPIKELQLREDFYQKMKKLNAVGAAATK